MYEFKLRFFLHSSAETGKLCELSVLEIEGNIHIKGIDRILDNDKILEDFKDCVNNFDELKLNEVYWSDCTFFIDDIEDMQDEYVDFNNVEME